MLALIEEAVDTLAKTAGLQDPQGAGGPGRGARLGAGH
jgi:hypothetical protein